MSAKDRIDFIPIDNYGKSRTKSQFWHIFEYPFCKFRNQTQKIKQHRHGAVFLPSQRTPDSKFRPLKLNETLHAVRDRCEKIDKGDEDRTHNNTQFVLSNERGKRKSK